MLSVFTTQTPSGLDSTGTGINVGLSWKSTQRGAAFGVSYYKRDATHDGQQLVGTLYDATGRVLAQKARTQSASDAVGWVFILFDTVAPVLSGQMYVSAVFYPTSAEPVGTKSMPVTNGVLTGIDTLYTSSSSVAVPSTSGTRNYFVDTLFNPSVFTADGHSLKVEVAFSGTRSGVTVSADPNDPTVTPTWVDVTNYVTDISSDRGKTYELDQARAGSYQVTFIGNDGRFDPGNVSSPYAPYVLCYRAIRVTAYNAAGTAFPLWHGYVQAWPHSWDQAGMWCTVTAPCIDALALLGQPIMNPAYQSEVLLDNPIGFWPLQDQSDSLNAGNLVTNGPLLTQNTVPSSGIPAGSVAAMAFGQEFGNMAGGSVNASSAGGDLVRGSGLLLTVDTSVVPPYGFYLSAPLPLNPVAGLTIEFWAIKGAVGEFVTLYNGMSGLDTRVYSDGNVLGVNVVDPTTGSWHQIGGTPTFPASTRALPSSGGCHVAVSWDGTNWRFYFNGSQVGGPYNDLHPGAKNGYSQINVGGRYSDGAALLNGSISQVAIYDHALSSTRIATHAQVGLAAAQGEDTAARFSRILSYIPWTGPSSVPAQGDTIEGRCDSIVGETALQSLLDVVDDEQSNMFVSAAGEITFEERKTRYLQAVPAAVFGENPGELHYEDGATVNYDPSLVYNSIQGQRTHGVQFAVRDIPSQLRYYILSYPDTPLTLRVNDDATVQQDINFLLARYKQPVQRVGQVTFDLMGNPSQADALLGLEIGDRVQFNRRQGGRPTVTLDCYIEDIAHAISASSSGPTWTIAFQLSPVFPVAAITDLRFTLKNPASSGATSITINPLPDASHNAAESSIPKGTQFSTPGSSTMFTVTGVTSSGVGYTSATITFTPALTSSKPVGQLFTEAPSVTGVYDDLATLGKYPIGL